MTNGPGRQGSRSGPPRAGTALLQLAILIAVTACAGALPEAGKTAVATGAAPSGAAATASRQTAATTAGSSSATTAPLLALVEEPAGATTLWRSSTAAGWQHVDLPDGATAIARDGSQLVLAYPDRIEIRSIRAPYALVSRTPLRWSAKVPRAPILAVDAVPPAIAIVTGDYGAWSYALVAADGSLAPLEPAPREPLTPLVGWIDADRLIVLSHDASGAGSVALVRPVAATTRPLPGVRGAVRWFALSADRRTVVEATEEAIWTADVDAWLGGTAPTQAVGLAFRRLAWALAVDATGFACATGSEAPDGTISEVRIETYVRATGGWRLLAAPVAPAGRILNLVWAS